MRLTRKGTWFSHEALQQLQTYNVNKSLILKQLNKQPLPWSSKQTETVSFTHQNFLYAFEMRFEEPTHVHILSMERKEMKKPKEMWVLTKKNLILSTKAKSSLSQLQINKGTLLTALKGKNIEKETVKVKIDSYCLSLCLKKEGEILTVLSIEAMLSEHDLNNSKLKFVFREAVFKTQLIRFQMNIKTFLPLLKEQSAFLGQEENEKTYAVANDTYRVTVTKQENKIIVSQVTNGAKHPALLGVKQSMKNQSFNFSVHVANRMKERKISYTDIRYMIKRSETLLSFQGNRVVMEGKNQQGNRVVMEGKNPQGKVFHAVLAYQNPKTPLTLITVYFVDEPL